MTHLEIGKMLTWCLLPQSHSPREFCTNTIPSQGPCLHRSSSHSRPPSLPPSHFSPLFILHSCPPNGTIQDMQGRRRRRFTQLNHAIPIDNGAMMANSPSPSTAMRCAASADPILFSLPLSSRLLISASQQHCPPPRRAYWF